MPLNNQLTNFEKLHFNYVPPGMRSSAFSATAREEISQISNLLRIDGVPSRANIIHYLRKQMPLGWGKKEKQDKLINRLDREFADCARRYGLARGDFPPVQFFKKVR